MANFNLDILNKALADTQDDDGVSFESQAKKWENEEQGECDEILVTFGNKKEN